MKLIIRFFLVAGAMMLAARLVPGIEVDAFWPTAVIAALLLGLLNITIRPLLALLTLPITMLSMGLFVFVINALMFWLLGYLDGFAVSGFVTALVGSLIVSAVSWIGDAVL